MLRIVPADLSGTPIRIPLLASALAAALLLSLTACSKGEEGGKQATQVAAKVGDSEISVHQINQFLSRTPLKDPTQQALQAASQQALERLIDQQVAVDAATEGNLQRTPEVIAALEAARRDVLARAYLQKVSAQSARATPEEVARYYREHPALFAERRVFSLQEVRMPDAGGELSELRNLAAQGKTVDDIAQHLTSKQVRFVRSSTSRTAEQIPLELLPRIHALRDGQSLVLETGQSVTVVRVASSQLAPLSEQEAGPVIEKFLNNRHLNEAIQQEVKRLRESTTISYLGDFQPTAGNATGANAAPSLQPAPNAPALADPTALERGVQGLK